MNTFREFRRKRLKKSIARIIDQGYAKGLTELSRINQRRVTKKFKQIDKIKAKQHAAFKRKAYSKLPPITPFD